MLAGKSVAIVVMAGEHAENDAGGPRMQRATDWLEIRLKNCGKRARAWRMWD